MRMWSNELTPHEGWGEECKWLPSEDKTRIVLSKSSWLVGQEYQRPIYRIIVTSQVKINIGEWEKKAGLL